MSDATPNGVSPSDQRTLRRSEERYRALVEAGSGIVWSWSPSEGGSDVARVQRWWEDVTGQPPEEQSRDRTGWLDVVHPEDREAAAAAWGSGLTESTAYDVEYRLRNRSGGWNHVHSRAVPIRGPGGAVREWVGMLTDVTEARRAEDERARLLHEVESERQKLAEVFLHAPSFMCVFRGPSHVFERANERYLEVMGRSRNDLIGRPVREAVPEVEGQGFFELLDRVYATGEPFVGTGVPVTLRRSGVLEERYLDLVYQPLRDRGAVTGIIVQGIDLTERKRAEDERVRAVAGSERQRRMFDTALSNSADYIYLIGTDGRFAYANKPLLDLWKIDASQVAGKSFADLGYPPELASRLEQQVQDVARARAPLRDEASVPIGSEVRSYEYIFMPVFGAGGEVEAVAGSTRDITERKAAETALRLSEERYRLAALATADAIWDIDIAANTVHWSERYTRAFGRPSETAGSWQWWIDHTHPADRERASTSLRAAVAGTDTHWTCAYRFLRADGVWADIEDRAYISRDGSGAAGRVIGAMRDVTDRKRDEAALRYQHALLRSQTEASPDGVLVVGPDRRLLSYNRRFLELWGIPAEVAAAGDRGTALDVARCRVADPDAFDARLAAIAADPDVWTRDEIPLTDGGTIERYGGPIRGADGEPLGRVWYFRDVTEAKRAEKAIRDREHLLGVVTASARLGLVMVSDEYEYLFANEAYAEILGLAVADIVGRRVEDLLPSRWPHVRPRLDRALAGEWDSYEIAHPPAPGGAEPRWFRVLCEPRRAEGERPKVVVVVMEITEQKRAERAVRVGEERYRWLLDVLPVAVFVHDGAAITFCNPAYVRLMGAAAADDLLGTNPFDRIHPDHHAVLRERLAEMAATGHGVFGTELRAVRLDGRAVPVFSVSAPLPDHGRPSYLIVLTDLTERERSTQMLRSVLASVGDAILTTDVGGTVRSANPAAEHAFGYPEPALVGGAVRVLLPGASWGAGAPAGGEVEGHRRDGTTFPAELTVTEFRFDGERRFTAVVRDITARKELEAEFRQAQKMEAFGQLAGGVAHDFNNLLTVINGYSVLLLRDRPAEHPDAESITEILAAGKRAADLTRQLLAFGRRQVLQPEELDLNEVITNLLKMLGRLLGEDVRLSTTLSPVLEPVRADPGQLEQVIVNLCVNARDAMPTGGRLTITTDPAVADEQAARLHPTVPPGRYARVSVADTGHGMTDAVKEKIFEPFFTTKPVGQGTGLGLSTVFGIVKQSGGHITVTSAVGRGTTFEVYLPVTASIAKTSEAAAPSRPLPGGRETVLLVEDERSVRKLTATFLRGAGYAVLEADGGAEAAHVHEAARGEVQLLLTDVVMPHESGRELAQRLTRAHPQLRVLFMSGYTDDRIMRHGIQSSEVAFIQKPFDMETLLEKIREVLDRPAAQ